MFRAGDRHGNVASEQLSAGSVARIVKRAANKQASTPKSSQVTRSAPVTPPPPPVAVPTTEPSCAKPDTAPAEPSTATSKLLERAALRSELDPGQRFQRPYRACACSGLRKLQSFAENFAVRELPSQPVAALAS